MDEKKKVIEDVDKDRRYAIDASIVRIMKSRKVLAHQQLVLECVEQLGRMFKVGFFSCLRLCRLQVVRWGYELSVPIVQCEVLASHNSFVSYERDGLELLRLFKAQNELL